MPNLETIVTPKGALKWVNISGVGKPPVGGEGAFTYVASLVLSKAEAQPLIDNIKSMYETNKDGKHALKSLGFKPCTSDGKVTTVDGPKKPDGTVPQIPQETADTTHFSFNFKTNTVFKNGGIKEIPVYNASNEVVNIGNKKIGDGSVGCISGKLAYYTYGADDGISMYLNFIQLLEFVEYKAEAGFQTQEGSFEKVEEEVSGFETQTSGAPKAKLD